MRIRCKDCKYFVPNRAHNPFLYVHGVTNSGHCSNEKKIERDGFPIIVRPDKLRNCPFAEPKGRDSDG